MNTNNIILGIMPLWSISFPHLGLAYLTANLNLHGYSVSQRDYCMDLHLVYSKSDNLHKLNISSDDYQNIYKRFILIYSEIETYLNDCAVELANNDAGIIGFSLLFSNVITTLTVAEKIKKINPEKIIVLGGAEANEHYMHSYIDYIVCGEGEISLVKLVDAINGKGKIDDIQGIIYRKGNSIIKTGNSTVNQELDRLPFPVFQNFVSKSYLQDCIPILASRGCINKCAFCSEYRLSPLFRTRSGENIAAEIKHQKALYPDFEFVFMDSLINGSLKVLNTMCDILIQQELNVTWVAKAAIRKQMTPVLLTKMRQSGCRSLMYGLESGSQSVLQGMNKPYTIETAEKVIIDTFEAGIGVQLFFVIGFPTETEENFQETLDFIRKIKRYINEIIPGEGCLVEKNTDLYENSQKYGIYWKDSSGKKDADNWFSEHTSPAIRKDRVKRFHDFIKKTEINMATWSTDVSIIQKHDTSLVF